MRAAACLCVLGSILLAIPAAAKDCSKVQTNHIPLIDLGTGTYNGMQGGLYPGGSNVRPASHDRDLDRVGRMVPLNTLGEYDPVNGVFVLLSIGNSNTDAEWQYFSDHVVTDPLMNDRVLLENGAQAGKNAEEISHPEDLFWNHVDEHLVADGLTPLQVQAVWLEEAVGSPTDSWPDDATTMLGYLRSIVQIIHSKYPNVKRIYHASRIYGAYSTNGQSPEPYCYDYGFSTKWLIEEQLNGSPDLNFDPAKGPVLAPWMAWGPYLWADGLNPRSDGLTWECADFRPDGKHPSEAGNTKVTSYLSNFFKNDPTTKTWFTDCDLGDLNVFGAPLEVRDLTVERLVTGEVRLSWESLDPVVGTGAVYDIVTGTIATLQQDQGYATATCHVQNVSDTPFMDSTPDPLPGQGYYYLVRGRDSCAAGTFGDSSLTPDPRDVLDASACTATTCGDLHADPGEQCDGPDLHGKTCSLLGYKGGSLACSSSCQFDTAGCSTGACGDGHVDPSEQCDGSNLNGETCVLLGHDGGTLACSPACILDQSGCTDCGDGVREGTESCDGSDLGGQTCQSQGYAGGTLACTGSCGFDTSACTTCGNGVREGSEACDGGDLGGATCQSLGFSGGTLACTASCGYDTAGCTP